MWIKGRNSIEGKEYYIWPIFSGRTWFPFDLYLIRMDKGSLIPIHLDKVPGKRHFRMNVILKKPTAGGNFLCKKATRIWRFIFFRPDLRYHSVSPVEQGTRLSLSIGAAF